MSSYLKHISIVLIVWLFRQFQKAAMELAEIEAAKNILQLAESVRKILKSLTVLVLIICSMGCGAVFFITGLLMAFCLLLLPEKYETTVQLLGIALPMILGGLISFFPGFIVVFFVMLSEEKWMKALLENEMTGPFLKRVITSAEMKKS